MSSKTKWTKQLPLVLVGGMIPTAVILGELSQWPSTILIPLVVVLALVFASMALWSYANSHTDGSEW